MGLALERTVSGMVLVDVLGLPAAQRSLPILSSPMSPLDVAGWVSLCSIPLAIATALTTLIGVRVLAADTRTSQILLLAAWPAALAAVAEPSAFAGALVAVGTLVLAAAIVAAAHSHRRWWRTLLWAAFLGALSLSTHATVRALSEAPTVFAAPVPVRDMPLPKSALQTKEALGDTTTADLVSDVPAPSRVILITVDTTRADHLSIYGYGRNTTPCLAAVADREGIVFERAYASSPWTRPSTASLMTSLSPQDHGVERKRQAIAMSVPTLAGALHADGFRTAAFVANGHAGASVNLHSGFEEFWETPRLVAGAIRTRALEWISLHADDRAFLYLHFIDPHADYAPLGRFREAFTDPDYDGSITGRFNSVRRFVSTTRQMPPRDLSHLVGLYDGEIAYTDHQLGRLFDALRDRGLWDDTLVILLSDHGEEFEDHLSLGHCHSLYEELIRIPLLVKLPGGRPAGFRPRVQERARIVDIAPTILQLTRSPMPATFEGESLIDAMRGPVADRDAYARTLGCEAELPLMEVIRHDRFKLVRRGGSREELYDLVADSGETHSLVEEQPALLDAMRARLEALTAETPVAEPVTRELSAQERDQLRALGYVE